MADDYASTTSTSGTVSVGGSTSGNIETAGDTDWFKITLTAGQTYQFDLKGSPSGNGSLPDPFLRLRDSAGNSITNAFADDGGTGLDSRFTYTPTSSGTYILSAGSSTASGTGTYKVFAANVTPVVTDDYASTTSTSGTVSVGGSTSGNIETAGDTDWFKITLTAGQTYQFDLKGSPSGNGSLPDPFLRLRDSAGNSITNAFADDGGTGLDSRFTYTPTSSGTYILSAGSSTASGTGTYKVFAADVTPVVTDDYASTTSTSGTVSVGGSTSGNIETAGDTDWFKITLTAGQTYQFDLKGSPSGNGSLPDPFLRLRDSAGNSITNAFADDGGTGLDSRFTYTPTSSGTYILSAGSSTASGTGTYKVFAADVTPVVTDDYASTTSTSGTVSVGGSTSGNIETAGDTDWFKITLTAGQTYQFDLKGSPSGNGSLPDPFLRLRDSAGNSITNAFADDGGTGLDSRFTYTPTSSGTYILSAGSSTASGTGTYKVFAADVTPVVTDDYASTTSTSGTVSVGGSTSGNIETAGDTDWFKITLTAGQTYQFDLKGSPSGNGSLPDPFLRLRDSAGNSITNAFADDGGTGLDSRFTYTPTSSGTYILSAGSSTASGTGTYKVFAADVTPVVTDDYASTTSTSGTVSVGGSTSGNIETAGDTDWFKITLTAGQTYQFDLKGSPSGNGSLPDPFLRLRDSAGNSITNAFADDGGTGLDSRFTYTPTSSGTYILSAGSSTASGTGTYKVFAADVTPVVTDDYASTTSTSGTVSVGGSTSGNIETAGDTDWFKITLTAGQTYQFDLKGSPSGNGSLPDPFLRLRDSAGNSITNAFADDGGTGLDSRFTYTPTSSGTYILSAGSSTASGTGTYKVFAADVTPVVTDDYASTTSTSGTVSVGGSTSGNIETAGDTDWFKITLTAGRSYRFDLEGSPSGQGTLTDPFLRLRDIAGSSISFNDDNGINFNSRISYNATASGTFILSIGSSSAGGTGSYRMSAIDVTPAVVDDYASNAGTAGTISVNSSTLGTIEAIGDTDWFKATLTAGHTYRFDLEGNSTGEGTLADPYMSLRDSTGNTKLAESDDGGTGYNARFVYTAATTGLYFLAAGTGFHTNGSGTYAMRLTDITPSSGDTIGKDILTAGLLSPGTTPGTIEQYDRDGSSIDADYYRVTLRGGHRYTFSADATVSSLDTLDQVFIRLRNQNGSGLSPDKFAQGTAPTFSYDVPGSGDITYFLSIGAGGSQLWQDKTGSYTVSMTDNGNSPVLISTTSTNWTELVDANTYAANINVIKNARLTPPSNTFLKDILGTPGLNPAHESAMVHDHLVSRTIDGVIGQVVGLDKAVDSLTQIFSRVFTDLPDLFGHINAGFPGGMLSVRTKNPTRGSSSDFSDHSWGIAIDLTVDNLPLDQNPDQMVARGIAAIIPYFNEGGWVAGAGWGADADDMHFEVARQTLALPTWYGTTLSARGDQPSSLVGSADSHVLSLNNESNPGQKLNIAAQGQNVVISDANTSDPLGYFTQFTELVLSGGNVIIGPLSGTDVANSTIIFDGRDDDDFLDARAADKRIVADGGPGNDALLAGFANDVLDGGSGNDTLDGGRGFDVAIYSDVRANYSVTRTGLVTTVSSIDGTDSVTSIELLQFADGTMPLTMNTSDFNSDLTSDILFRSGASGDTGFYQMNSNGTLQGWHGIGASSTAYSVAGTGDFSGDGVSDILFRSGASGDTGFYQMNSNGTLQGWHSIGASSPAYGVAGIGDFNGDGVSDILFRNSASGDTGFYQMNNGTLQGWHGIGASSTAYAIVGVGDFNADGVSDILFRNNASGDTGFYQMNSNGTLQGWHSIGASSTAYAIVGVGDFNADGVSDILFRNNASGDTGFYQMNSNGTLQGWHSIGASSSAYGVVGIGDYNSDGTSDILFRNTATGDTGFYQMNSNGTLQGWHGIGASSTAYGVVG